MQIIYAILALGLIGLIFGLLLAVAARYFAVRTDPRVEAVRGVLPGANCGACGYPSCINFAEAVVHEEAPTNGCIPGQDEVAVAVAEVLGREVITVKPLVATVFCCGDQAKAVDRFIYDGIKDCSVALQYNNGFKACQYGCLGLGSCVRACPFEVLSMGSHGLPVVDADSCTGCGLCVKACPQNLIKILPQNDRGHLVLCSSHDRGKSVSKACSVGCIACKACIKACPQEAIEMVDNLAVIDIDKCDDCGKCVEACKPGTIYKRTSIPSKPGEEKVLITAENTSDK